MLPPVHALQANVRNANDKAALDSKTDAKGRHRKSHRVRALSYRTTHHGSTKELDTHSRREVGITRAVIRVMAADTLRLNSRAVACWLILHHSAAAYASLTYHSRRHAILSSTAAATAAAAPPAASADTTAQSMMTEVSDGTYSALAYAPRTREVLPPLLVVLHGAGINKLPVWNLADPTGEHAGEMDGFIRTASSAKLTRHWPRSS